MRKIQNKNNTHHNSMETKVWNILCQYPLIYNKPYPKKGLQQQRKYSLKELCVYQFIDLWSFKIGVLRFVSCGFWCIPM